MANRTSKSTRRPQGLSPAEILEWHGWDVHPETGCWEWRGDLDRKGYGRVRSRPHFGASWGAAHRISFEVYTGATADGHVVRHSCDNPPCINPAHLLVGTVQDNMRDMAERKRQHYQARTRCKRDHDLTLPDAYFVQSMRRRDGSRIDVNRCRLCYEAAVARSRENRKARHDQDCDPTS